MISKTIFTILSISLGFYFSPMGLADTESSQTEMTQTKMTKQEQTTRKPTTCPIIGKDGKYHTVDEHLDWCAKNSGFNEGAVCGLSALKTTGVSGLPPMMDEKILGNLWNRIQMMDATKAAYRAGKREEAISATVCCQIHTPDAHECLSKERKAVSEWLAEKTK